MIKGKPLETLIALLYFSHEFINKVFFREQEKSYHPQPTSNVIPYPEGEDV